VSPARPTLGQQRTDKWQHVATVAQTVIVHVRAGWIAPPGAIRVEQRRNERRNVGPVEHAVAVQITGNWDRRTELIGPDVHRRPEDPRMPVVIHGYGLGAVSVVVEVQLFG